MEDSIPILCWMVTVSHISKPEQLKIQITFFIVIRLISFYLQWNQTNSFWRLRETTKNVSNVRQNQGRFYCSERRMAMASESQSEWQTLLWSITNWCKIPADSRSLPSKVSSWCSLMLGKPRDPDSPYLRQIDFDPHWCPGLKNRLQVSLTHPYLLLPVKIGRIITFLWIFMPFTFYILFFLSWVLFLVRSPNWAVTKISHHISFLPLHITKPPKPFGHLGKYEQVLNAIFSNTRNFLPLHHADLYPLVYWSHLLWT